PAHPALNGGRGLKQRRSGLLWSRRPSKGRHLRGLSILAGRAERDLPLQAKAASSGLEPAHSCLHRTCAAPSPHPLTPGIARMRFAQNRNCGRLRPFEPREESAMTARIRDYLRRTPDDGPRLVVDLDVVRDNYLTFAKALPDTRVFYAVKANPALEV